MKTIHIANTTSGEYDVRKPLPYPFHINDDGSVDRQDFWRGTPARLAGFQRESDVQHVDVFAHDWLSGDVDVEGMFPVFIDNGGGMWSHTFPVTHVTVVEVAPS